MKLSLNWVQEYFDFKLDANDISNKLIDLGLEIEAVEEIDAIFEGQVCFVEILDIKPHPNADKLQLATVSDGKQNYSIVCGAKNIEVGLLAPMIYVGSTIQGHKIKESKIRGKTSQGMLCSEKELGISNDSQGVITSKNKELIGLDIREIVLFKDIVFELGITPNRGDCLSVKGIAREIAAAYNIALIDKKKKKKKQERGNEVISIECLEKDLCSLYSSSISRNMTVIPSSLQIKYRLHSVGLRPINNIVDLTNLFLWEYGQPMHAFDLDVIQNKKVFIRRASSQEKFLALDDNEYSLTGDELVISDDSNILALAGVIGGKNSSVTENTKNVLFECAVFDPSSVRLNSKIHNIKTDSSYRFEREVDSNRIKDILEKITLSLPEDADINIIESFGKASDSKIVDFNLTECNGLLGLKLTENEVINLLARIEINRFKNTGLSFIIPGFRNDITRSVDLYEEVARIYGYNKIPEHKEVIQPTILNKNSNYEKIKKLKQFLISLNLNEAINFSFVNSKDVEPFRQELDEDFKSWTLANPLSPDLAVMRTSILPCLLKNYILNKSYQYENIRLFEVGNIFPLYKSNQLDETHYQRQKLGLLIAGTQTCRNFSEAVVNNDFYELKGLFQSIAHFKNLKEYSFVKEKSFLFEYYQAIICSEDRKLGFFGKLKNEKFKHYKIKEDIYYLEFDLQALFSDSVNSKTSIKPLLRFPYIKEDMSLVVDEKIEYAQIIRLIKEKNIPELVDIHLFDIYDGKSIEKGKKSMSFSLKYQDPNKTLVSQDIIKKHEEIRQHLVKSIKAVFR